jgi:hypothetical protein
MVRPEPKQELLGLELATMERGRQIARIAVQPSPQPPKMGGQPIQQHDHNSLIRNLSRLCGFRISRCPQQQQQHKKISEKMLSLTTINMMAQLEKGTVTKKS